MDPSNTDQAPVTESIRQLQDTTLTLRMSIPAIFKKLLLRECEMEHQKIIETDIAVPKQPIHELAKLERVERQGLPQLNTAKEVQEVHQLLNILDRLFPSNNR